MTTATTMPVLYLSHGAPPLADDKLWTGQLATWSKDLPKPKAILMVSAHWEEAPLTVSATTTVPLVYDFWGFPQHYYEVQYAAPGAPQLADRVRQLLGQQVHDAPERGLDHGAYVPLVEMYPDADVPVLQMSMPTLDPEKLMAVGRKLAPLRDEGVLIVGSGFFTHNLSAMQSVGTPDLVLGVRRVGPPRPRRRRRRLAAGLRAQGPGRAAGPPAHRALRAAVRHVGGTQDELGTQRTVIDGFWHGLAKRSWQLT